MSLFRVYMIVQVVLAHGMALCASSSYNSPICLLVSCFVISNGGV